MKKVNVEVETNTLMIDVAQSVDYEQLQLYFETDEHVVYQLHKAVLTVDDTIVNYRFSLDLSLLLGTLIATTSMPKRLVLMYCYTRLKCANW